jgi:uncharacterized protein (DUF302 family)
MASQAISITFSATRVVIPAEQPYEQVIQAIEERVGRVDYTVLDRIIAEQRPLEDVADAFVGSSTFMYLAKINQGRILSLSGHPKKASLYVLGNPLIGNQLLDVTSAVGLYFPFRLFAYENEEGQAFVAYDVPSSLVRQYNNEALLPLAHKFDEQLEQLARAVTSKQKS